MQHPMTHRLLQLKPDIGMRDEERFLTKYSFYSQPCFLSLDLVQEALLRRFWKMNGTTSENEGTKMSVSAHKFENLTHVISAEFLRKVMTELRRELPHGGCSELLMAIRQYLSEYSDGCFSRERNFADALQNLVDKYQVHVPTPSACRRTLMTRRARRSRCSSNTPPCATGGASCGRPPPTAAAGGAGARWPAGGGTGPTPGSRRGRGGD